MHLSLTSQHTGYLGRGWLHGVGRAGEEGKAGGQTQARGREGWLVERVGLWIYSG